MPALSDRHLEHRLRLIERTLARVSAPAKPAIDRRTTFLVAAAGRSL